MAINIESEELVRLTKAGALIPHRPHVSTLFRWAERGVRGAKLETVQLGGATFTSKEALHRFFVGCSGDNAVAPSKQRRKAIEAAEARLTRAGVK